MEALEGELRATKVFPNGDIEEVFHEKNLIMLGSKQRLLRMTYATAGAWDPITSLRLGIGGTLDPVGLYPKAVNQLLTSLYSELVSLPTFYTLAEQIPSITFIADLDQSMGNGEKITEAGLFTTGGSMFNIKCFPSIDKTSEFSLHFEWTIKIS